MRLIYFVLSVYLLLTQGFAHAQVTGTVTIDGGRKFTNSRDGSVTLSISAVNATQMMISNNGSFEGALWEQLQYAKKWRLAASAGDGLKQVYAKFKDAAGNVSEVVEGQIELDRQPPTGGTVVINYGAQYVGAGQEFITLEIDVDDKYAVMVSNRKDFLGATWRKFASNIKLPLQGKDGKVDVFVKFKDKAGNESEIVSSSIIWDKTPPQNCSVEINNGEKYTRSRKVKLKFKSSDAAQYIVKEGSGWTAFAPEVDWELSPGDGLKEVSVKFKDAAGNISTEAYTAKIILDTNPPTNGFIQINDGAIFTNKYNEVHLKIAAIGADEMIVGQDSFFTNLRWEPFANVKSSYAVNEVDGLKVIYVKFRDKAGNMSRVYADSIYLDRTAPVAQSVELVDEKIVVIPQTKQKIIKTDAKKIDLKLKAEGADYMKISSVNSFYGAAWEKYREDYPGWEWGNQEKGKINVFVIFKDAAGNESKIVSDFLILDNEPPVDCSIFIDNKKEFCTHSEGKVKLSLNARGADLMMIANEPTFKNANYEPYLKDKDWVLTENDGIKTVYVKFKDIAGNETELFSDNIVLDRKPPYEASLVINRGEERTNNPDKVVILRLRAKEARSMQISNSKSFDGLRWIPFNELNIAHSLVGEDGLKVVYARFMDEAENISPIVSDTIILDRKPPTQGKVVIKDADKLNGMTPTDKVQLELYADGAVEMMVSNSIDMKGVSWEPYTTSKDWTLVGQDGLKTVYAQFRDKTGNVSTLAYARIGVDRQAPKDGKITLLGQDRLGNTGSNSTIDNTKFCTNINKYVTVRAYTDDADQMWISNSKEFTDGAWEPYSLIKYNFILAGEDGEKTVWAKFKDKAGNETNPVSANITLDRQEPYDAQIIIEQGSTYCRTNNVRLELKVSDAQEMIVSASPLFLPPAKWVRYEPQISYQLSPGDGEKRLFVKYRDKAGNESAPANAKIIVDSEAPVIKALKINGGKTSTNSTQVELTFDVLGAQQMMVSNSSQFGGGYWDDFSGKINWTLESGLGLKVVYVKFKDLAGNETQPRNVNITLID
jgi:hypothetical protein